MWPEPRTCPSPARPAGGLSPGRGPRAKAVLRPAAMGALGRTHHLVTHGDCKSQWGWHRAGTGQCHGLHVSCLTGTCGLKGEGPDLPAGCTFWTLLGLCPHPPGSAEGQAGISPQVLQRQTGEPDAGGQPAGNPRTGAGSPLWARPPLGWDASHWSMVPPEGRPGLNEVPHPSAQHPARTWPDISTASQAGGTGCTGGAQGSGGQ